MKYFLCLLIAISPIIASAQTAVLTQDNNEVLLRMPGTVTFKSGSSAHIDLVQKIGLKHISGQTYSAAILCETSFYHKVSRGKVFNYTDNSITIECSFYYRNSCVARYVRKVNPRTFIRMVPDDEHTPEACDKIICRVL